MSTPARAALCVAAVLAAACGALGDFGACAKKTGAAVLAPGDAGFDAAVNRALFPRPVPAFYVDVADAAELPGVVKCAKEEGLGVCPRSGGHSFIGQSSCDGVVVDVWKMKEVVLEEGEGRLRVQAGATLAEMFFEVLEQSGDGKMVGIGLCPSVGVAGYMLGGGHNPYSGKLGLTCESVEEYEYVTLDGEFVKANAKENKELFWASCGGGGGHFGILHRFTIKTHDAAFFQKNVFFRYEWPISAAGEVIHKWMQYDQDDGDTWFRLEINANSPLYGYGVCWDASSVAACESRLAKNPFFNVKGRFTNIAETGNLADFQMFIGPAGGWAWKKSTLTRKQAFVGQNWDEAGKGVSRVYSSAFWHTENAKPDQAFYQKMADLCHEVELSTIDFSLCQWNPWRGKQRSTAADKHAFAGREADAFTEFIGAAKNTTVTAGINQLKRIDKDLRDHTAHLVSSVYVSYPEPDFVGLTQEEYSFLYWGQSLPRLAALKAKFDPDSRFKQTQPMPSGDLKCPGKLDVDGSGPTYSLEIDGYMDGARPGMHLAFALPKGCTVRAAKNGKVEEVEASGGDGTVYDAEFFTKDAVQIETDGDDCEPELVAINSISCSTKFSLAGNQPPPTSSSKSEDASPDSGSSSSGCFPSSATVETEDRGSVAMHSLSVGDRVLVADGSFSPVYFFSHKSPHVSSMPFVTVTTSSGPSNSSAPSSTCAHSTLRSVTLTSTHYLPTLRGELKPAGSLAQGDVLAGKQVVVSVVSAGAQAGLYNPHTDAGTIVVDGVVASCYTTALPPMLARALLAPLKVAFRVFRVTLKLESLLDIARPRLAWFGSSSM